MFSPGDIILESAKLEMHNCDSAQVAMDAKELSSEYKELPEVDTNVPITADQVPVLQQEGSLENGQPCKDFLVDAEDLSRYMDSNDLDDPVVAMAAIADANNIEPQQMAVVMPESAFVRRIIEESKIDVRLGYQVSSALAFYKNLMNKGLTVYKKKGKT